MVAVDLLHVLQNLGQNLQMTRLAPVVQVAEVKELEYHTSQMLHSSI